MKVAVLTLTRDRLDYTKHCFATLRACAGVDYHHYVLDQGSQDGTAEWLENEWLPADYLNRRVIFKPGNVGISAGMNMLLDAMQFRFDVIVKVDNDCELLMRDTLKDVAAATLESGWLLSPRIQGLRQPPPMSEPQLVGGELVGEVVPNIGGIFLAAPASLYAHGFRFSESNAPWGGDDTEICAWYRHQGSHCGYVARIAANHYETTNGQWSRYPEYFKRKQAEGMPG